MALVVAGRVVPLSRQLAVAPRESSSFRGKVWIDDAGRIAAVTRGRKAGPPGFDSAPVVDVGSHLVLPGFIDLHSHLAYATLPLWVEPNRIVPFIHHDIWPTRPTYAESVTWPAYAFVVAAPAELLAYAEVRALVGGTTSIQGSPPSNRSLDGWLARNVEDETLAGAVGKDQVLASTLTMKPDQLGERAARIRDGAVFIYHCAEGQSGSIVTREFVALAQAGCLQDRLVVIHTNALDPAAYGSWTAPGSMVWSPFSNLWLYGTTTDVRAVRARGLNVCVGSDWGPSGTRNVLGELKVASLVSEDKGWNLTPLELVKMITANPGDALGKAWNVQAGRLEPKALGDLVIVAARKGADPFDTVVRATERDVLLVVVRGRPLYGTTDLMQAAGATRSSAVDVAGERRRLAFTRLDTPDVAWSFAEVRARLDEVRAHPKEAIEEARSEARAALGEHRPPPLRLALDMPTGRVPLGGLPKDLGQIRVPPIQPLAHDQAFFASIHGRGFHRGLLDRLATFYSQERA